MLNGYIVAFFIHFFKHYRIHALQRGRRTKVSLGMTVNYFLGTNRDRSPIEYGICTIDYSKMVKKVVILLQHTSNSGAGNHNTPLHTPRRPMLNEKQTVHVHQRQNESSTAVRSLSPQIRAQASSRTTVRKISSSNNQAAAMRQQASSHSTVYSADRGNQVPHQHSQQHNRLPAPQLSEHLQSDYEPTVQQLPQQLQASQLQLPTAPPKQSSGGLLSGLNLSKLSNLTEIKGWVDRMGGLDGILTTVTKAQKIVSSVSQMAPMVKLFFGSFGGSKNDKSEKEQNHHSSRPRRRRRRRKSSPYSPNSTKRRPRRPY